MPTSTPQSRRAAAARKPRTGGAESAPSGPAPRRPPSRPKPAADRSDLCEVQVVDRDKIARARASLPAPDVLAGLAEMLRALGDPTRLQIVCALATEGVDELCVCDLATLVGVSDSAVSHSLRSLRQLGVVRYRKAGKIAYYTLDDSHVGEMVREGIRHLEGDR